MTKFEVSFTADVVTEESAAHGDADRRGWVDINWSRTMVHENKEDVRVHLFDTREEAEEFIESEIGSADSYDGEHWYAADSHTDLQTGEDWSYCGHITEVE
jgi:hypothetical protein